MTEKFPSCQPCAMNTRPFAEIEYPIFILRFFATLVGGIESFRPHAIFTLESQEFFFERMNIGQYLQNRFPRDE